MRPLLTFLRGESGSVSVEALMIFPVLAWFYLGMYVFFDGFRDQTTNVRAAYTIGDILSRQTDYITPAFMDGMYALQSNLTGATGTKLRVTKFTYSASGDKFVNVWSQTRGGVTAHTAATLALLRDRIPVMANGDVAVMTETWANYTPPMDVGLDPLVFSEAIVTRPRFALNGRFCWNSVNTGGTPATETC